MDACCVYHFVLVSKFNIVLWPLCKNLISYHIDNIPPVLAFCPGPIYATRDAGQDGVLVTFDVPAAHDNNLSGTLTVVTSPPSITSPYFFRESTEVSYTFTDESGNGVTCTFRVLVLGEGRKLRQRFIQFSVNRNLLTAVWAGQT